MRALHPVLALSWGLAMGLPSAALGSDGLPDLRCEAKGGDPWTEYRSKHFLVATDAPPGRAATLVKDLEQLFALEQQALLGGQADIPGRLRVIAPSSERLFRTLTGSDTVAGYFKPGLLGEPLIVLSISRQRASPEVVAHELAHYLSWHLFPRQPRWFAEGLATFAQTVASSQGEAVAPTGSHIKRGEAGHGHAAGRAPGALLAEVDWVKPVGGKELLEWRSEDEDSPSRYHVWSWLLYHWLWNQRSRPFSAFQERLAAAEDPATAWRATFPELNPENPQAMAALTATLDDYRKNGRYLYVRVEAASEPGFTSAPLSSAEVHLRLLEARRHMDEKLARPELAEALREDPAHPWAIALLAELDGTPTLEPLRASVRARPGDWRGWLLLGRALAGDDARAEREAAFRKAVALAPESAAAQGALSGELLARGLAKEALPFANRAVDLAPGSPHAIGILASVAAELGKCAEAVQLQRRAAALATGEEKGRWFTEVEDRCAKASPKAR